VCIVSGLGLIASSVLLSRLRVPDWSNEHDVGSSSHAAAMKWSAFQRGVRKTNNVLLAGTGILICTAGLLEHGQVWMIVWLGVVLLLMIVFLLACIDAFSSMTGYRRTVPEAARRSFGDQKDSQS